MIQITKDLAIQANRHQYIVGTPRHRLNKDGQTVFSLGNPSYFSTMEQALKNCISRTMRSKVQNGEIETLRGFLDELESVTQEIKKLTEPFGV